MPPGQSHSLGQTQTRALGPGQTRIPSGRGESKRRRVAMNPVTLRPWRVIGAEKETLGNEFCLPVLMRVV